MKSWSSLGKQGGFWKTNPPQGERLYPGKQDNHNFKLKHSKQQKKHYGK